MWQVHVLSILFVVAVLGSQAQGFAPVSPAPSAPRKAPSSGVDPQCSRSDGLSTSTTRASTSSQTLAVIQGRRKRLAFGSLATSSSSSLLSSTSSTAVTELPDSLQDAAIRAAQASASFAELAGPVARCRVDFDTTIGDETYTMLKSTTEFMQGIVTALAKIVVPGVEQQYMDDQMRVVQARVELKQLEQQQAQGAAETTTEGGGDDDDDDDDARMQQEKREEELLQIIQNGGRTSEPWDGPVVRVYFPDEGSAALARRDWSGKHVPACVQFSSCGGVQQHKIDRDQVVFFYCPRASESDSVEAILARHETMSTDLKLTVFVNPNLVDMGVTGFGLAGRMLRERLIDPLQHTYYLRTLAWGALTRQWPNAYSVWQEDEGEVGGYRLIQTLDRLPSNPEVQDIYDQENGGRSDADGGGPGVLNQLGDFINGMMRL